MAYDYEVAYSAYIEKLKQRVQDALDKAFKDAYADFFKLIDSRIQEIYQNAADKFYQAYDPIFYKDERRGSLKKMLVTEVGYDYFSGEFKDDGILNRKGGSLYDQVFKQGYHGGASTGPRHPQEGTPWYRTPHPSKAKIAKKITSRHGAMPMFGKYSKGRARPWVMWSKFSAKQTESVYDIFMKMKTEYENGPGYDAEFQKILEKKRSEYLKQI